MFFHIIPFIYTLIFLLAGEVAVYQPRYSVYLVCFLFIFIFWSIRKTTNHFSHTIIPIILSSSSLALLFLIDLIAEKQIFLILSAFIYYLTLLGIYRLKSYFKDQTARGLIAAGAAASVFLFYSGAYGIYLNYQIPLWVLMLSFLTITIAVSYQYFRLLSVDRKKVLNYSLILAMIMTEIAWVINFWPFGYLTTGAVILIFYYVLWDLTQSHFLDKLSKKRVIANIVFFSILIGLILASSSWLPMV